MKKDTTEKGIVYVGTSNIVVPGNKASFPIAFRNKSRLNYYSHLFNSLEVNSSFYKVPLRKTFEKWSLDVPTDFRFTIKLSKEITHVKNLDADLNKIDHFLNAAEGTGNKKACLLVQFPGKITPGYFNEVATIIEHIAKHDPANEWKKAIEFRHPDWYIGETYEMLDENDASMVVHDIPKSANFVTNKKSGFVYLRFHGPKGDYRDSYSTGFLKEKADQIKAWSREGKKVYAYFNNTIGSAFENAQTLKEMLE